MENLNLMSVEVMAIGDLVLNKIDDLCAKRKILYLNGKSKPTKTFSSNFISNMKRW